MPPSIRRRGAPRGNQNARKHGFYSRYSSSNELAASAGLPPGSVDDLEHQIETIRLYMHRVSELGMQSNDLGLLLNLLRGMCMASSRLAQLQRRQSQLNMLRENKAEIESFFKSFTAGLDQLDQPK